MKNTIGLGDLAEKVINFVTFGYGKRIATFVAKFRLRDDTKSTDD